MIQADILVYVALGEEFNDLVDILRDEFDQTLDPTELQDVNLTCYQTIFDDVKVVFVPAGQMGNTRAAAACSAALIACPAPNLVVLGIAGALDDELQPGDVLIPKSVHEYMANSSAENTESLAFTTSGNHYLTHLRLLDRFQNFRTARREQFDAWSGHARRFQDRWFDAELRTYLGDAKLAPRWDAQLVVGDDRVLASGPTVGKSIGFRNWLRAQVDRKVVALEMESAGGFDAAALRDPAPRVVAIRGISDPADERKRILEREAKQGFRKLAVANALALLVEAVHARLFDGGSHHTRDEWSVSSPPEASGAKDMTESLYVPWSAEEERARGWLDEGQSVVVFAPWQSGKTYFYDSLLTGLRDGYCRVELKARSIPGDVESSDSFLKWVAALIVRGCGGDPAWVHEAWKADDYDTMRFENLLEQWVLPAALRPVVLAMDDSDLIFRYSPRTRLFNLLRNFQGRASPWDRFRVFATVRQTLRQLKETYGEGSFFVHSRMIELPGLRDEQIRALATRRSVRLEKDDFHSCRKVLDGHPYFTDQILIEAARTGESVRHCLELAAELFETELRNLAEGLDLGARDAFTHLLEQEGARFDDATSDKLYSKGLVRRKQRRHYVRCSLYRHLGKWLS